MGLLMADGSRWSGSSTYPASEDRMVTFKGDEKLKALVIRRLERHIELDKLIQSGRYYYRPSDKTGCWLGCITRDPEDTHYKAALKFGLPVYITAIGEFFFERLPSYATNETETETGGEDDDDRDGEDLPRVVRPDTRFHRMKTIVKQNSPSADFSVDVIRAIPVGADLETAYWQYIYWLLTDQKWGFMPHYSTKYLYVRDLRGESLPLVEYPLDVLGPLTGLMGVYKRLADGEDFCLATDEAFKDVQERFDKVYVMADFLAGFGQNKYTFLRWLFDPGHTYSTGPSILVQLLGKDTSDFGTKNLSRWGSDLQVYADKFIEVLRGVKKSYAVTE